MADPRAPKRKVIRMTEKKPVFYPKVVKKSKREKPKYMRRPYKKKDPFSREKNFARLTVL